MFGRTWRSRLVGAALVALLASPYTIADLDAAQRGRGLLSSKGLVKKQAPRRFEEPAYARGYADGHARGLDNGRKQERYDPVGGREYRDADQGFQESYGSRDAYRNNYRAGFRQGYEDGYREGTR
jgi:hypothetical protein